MPTYSEEPENRHAFTSSFDRAYSRFARAYDAAIKLAPLWKAWLRPALPYLQGPRVLEVSFGTGYLLTEYAGRFEAHGLDLILIDINYPPNGNWFGTRLTELWKRGGDLIRDMGSLFQRCSVDCTDKTIGGWGSVHLYVATKSLPLS